MSPDLSAIADEAVTLAAELFRSRPAGTLTPKGDRDYASEVDYAIESEVAKFLADRTPSIGFFGEEGGLHREGDQFWILDPIDGTVNFTHSLPLCGISLALVSGNKPLIGIIDLPFLGTRYRASRGEGSYCNGTRISTSTTDRISAAVVSVGDYAVGEGAESKNRARIALTSILAGKVLRVRMVGSAATDLAWLAAGHTDASITLSNNSWDMAAGVVIAQEAGIKVIDRDSSDYTCNSTCTIAATPALLDDMVRMVNDSFRLADAGRAGVSS